MIMTENQGTCAVRDEENGVVEYDSISNSGTDYSLVTHMVIRGNFDPKIVRLCGELEVIKIIGCPCIRGLCEFPSVKRLILRLSEYNDGKLFLPELEHLEIIDCSSDDVVQIPVMKNLKFLRICDGFTVDFEGPVINDRLEELHLDRYKGCFSWIPSCLKKLVVKNHDGREALFLPQLVALEVVNWKIDFCTQNLSETISDLYIESPAEIDDVTLVSLVGMKSIRLVGQEKVTPKPFTGYFLLEEVTIVDCRRIIFPELLLCIPIAARVKDTFRVNGEEDLKKQYDLWKEQFHFELESAKRRLKIQYRKNDALLGRGSGSKLFLGEYREGNSYHECVIKATDNTREDLLVNLNKLISGGINTNVLEVLGFDGEDGLLLEKCDMNLEQYIHAFKLSDEEKYLLYRCIANGLSCIHRNGLVHCSLRSSSILIKDGVPKIGNLDYMMTRDEGECRIRVFGQKYPAEYLDTMAFGKIGEIIFKSGEGEIPDCICEVIKLCNKPGSSFLEVERYLDIVFSVFHWPSVLKNRSSLKIAVKELLGSSCLLIDEKDVKISKLDGLIGFGAYSKVFHGIYRKRGLDRSVAVKEIIPKNRKEVELIETEIQILLKSGMYKEIQRGICCCHGYFISIEIPSVSLVFERCDEDLRTWKKRNDSKAKTENERNELFLKKVEKIILPVAKTLEGLKDIQIAHRDVKLSNILIVNDCDGDFQAKLGDFGVSSIIGVGRGLNDALGSYMYMPSELILNDPGVEIDLRFHDVYSFGMMCWELLIHGNEEYDRIRNEYFNPEFPQKREEYHRNRLSPPVMEIGRLSPRLAKMILGCLHPIKEERISFGDIVGIVEDELEENTVFQSIKMLNSVESGSTVDNDKILMDGSSTVLVSSDVTND